MMLDARGRKVTDRAIRMNLADMKAIAGRSRTGSTAGAPQ